MKNKDTSTNDLEAIIRGYQPLKTPINPDPTKIEGGYQPKKTDLAPPPKKP